MPTVNIQRALGLKANRKEKDLKGKNSDSLSWKQQQNCMLSSYKDYMASPNKIIWERS